MANVNFTYAYPYGGYSNCKYGWDFSDNRITINGNYTYPCEFKIPLPKCTKIKFTIWLSEDSSSSVYGRSWDVYVYSSGWTRLASFVMPQDGTYTYDGTVPNCNVSKFLMVPSSKMSSSTTWGTGYSLGGFTITESLAENTLTTGMFHYGIFENDYGVSPDIREVFVNIDGVLKRPTKIYANVEDELKPIRDVYSAYLKTQSESTTLYSFTPPETGTYKIKNNRLSGDHEIRLYDNSFTLLYSNYFYDRSFELTQGSVYYITQTHYYSAGESESYLQIYKED